MTRPDVAAVVVFHREGAFAVPALASLRRMAHTAEEAGVRVDTVAILNAADARTSSIVASAEDWLTRIVVNSDGDLAVARNGALEVSSASHVAFLDGDDLWGERWLTEALAAALDDPESIYHPEWLWYFAEGDFHRFSTEDTPHHSARSHFLRQASSMGPGFDRRSLFVTNPWSANTLANREIFQQYPYRPVDRSLGLGIEDWSWNIETLLGAGIEHRIVPNTVHMIRMKADGSLGIRNDLEGLAVAIPEGVSWSRG